MNSRYEELLLPEQRDRIVDRVVKALKSKDQLSSRSVDKFRDILKAGKPIPGFNNDPIRALPHLLKQNMLDRLGDVRSFEHIVVDLWTQAETRLEEVVRKHVEDLDREIFLADEVDEDFWDAQVRLLADKHSEYEENDILLMTKVCYAHAKIEAEIIAELDTDYDASEIEATEAVMDTASDALSDVLNRLRMLPVESPAWDEEIPQFAEAVNNLVADKIEEHNRLRSRILLDDIEELDSFMISDMEFFGRSATDWNIDNLTTSAHLPEAARLVSELKAALQIYRTMKDRADTLAEERDRRDRRHNLEDSIEQTLSEIDEIARNADAPNIDAPPKDLRIEGNAARATQPQSRSEPAAKLQEEMRALTETNAALEDANRSLEQDLTSIRDENGALRGEVAGLNADKQTLAEEIAELKDQLRISESRELNWRNTYESEVSGKGVSAPAAVLPEVESIQQAISLARERYGDKLLLHFNNKSDTDYNYSRPKEVWDALEWLATTYHDRQTGKIRVRDLNKSIRNVCSGWKYIPDQSDITFNTYREWYTTKRDGVPYELREHIGRWAARQGNNLIRIAFNWDEQAQRVVVGYIGRHQRNRTS